MLYLAPTSSILRLLIAAQEFARQTRPSLRRFLQANRLREERRGRGARSRGKEAEGGQEHLRGEDSYSYFPFSCPVLAKPNKPCFEGKCT